MSPRILTISLSVGLCMALVVLGSAMTSWRLPDNDQGYAPRQPIEFSHQLHAGEMQINCQFCHTGAAKGRYAGIPSSEVCMKCHTLVTCGFDVLQEERKRADEEQRDPAPPVSDELRKLYKALGLDDSNKPTPGVDARPIEWVQVHNLPDYVYFDHSAHVSAGVSCQHCHGPVESMRRMRQQETLSMGWCVNCHRDATANGVAGQQVEARTNCSVCHY